MKSLFTLVALIFLTGAAPPVVSRPIHLCPALGSLECKPVQLEEISVDEAEITLVRKVEVSARALPLENPLMVRIVAMASSEVRWNGVMVGRNGVPGPSAAREVPGRFEAVFTVPREIVRPGVNVVSVRLSAHHAWLPVKPTIQAFYVGPYRSPQFRGLWLYLPALLLLGVLAATFVYFASATFSNRQDRAARLVAVIAGLATLQLVLEVSRAFISYSYPWYLMRLAGIAVVAGVTAVFITSYAAHRFAPSWSRPLVMTIAGVAAISILFMPWYAFKTLGAILAGTAGLAVCSWYGLRRQRRAAWVGLATSLTMVAMIALQGSAFLVRGYYLVLGALLMILTAEQVGNARRIRLERDAERKRAEALAERLSQAEREGEPIVVLKTGTQVQRVAESDILYVQAADDYCEVVLASGRRVLVTMTLANFLATMSPQFLRVHKSYGVNRANVTGAKAKPGGGRNLVLGQQVVVPVGRSYGKEVAAWLS